MRLALLTTDTLHHAFFARRLAERFAIRQIVLESARVPPPFAVDHPFEGRREDHERRRFWGDQPLCWADLAEIREVRAVGDAACRAHLQAVRPDVILVFGTGRLPQAVIDVCPEGILNLHGGDPRAYRGLDSHLWAIYHRDFAALLVTLHRVTAVLDDGAIVSQAAVPLRPRMGLHELRSETAEICVALAWRALQDYATGGAFQSTPQERRGRYYSHMPAVLKERCVQHFETHTRGL